MFLSDDNNLPQYSIDDYFNLGMYDGDIYKTRNLRNLSMMQMFPDPDDLARAQDSIDNRLKTTVKTSGFRHVKNISPKRQGGGTQTRCGGSRYHPRAHCGKRG